MDDDGYPTEEDLETVRTFHGTPRQFVETLRTLWWPDDHYITVRTVVDTQGWVQVEVGVSTVGWSGNEEIISTVEATFFHLLWWASTRRGGHYTYLIPDDQYDATWDLSVLT